MKSKISINIDSELLSIIRDYSDSDLDSMIQDALSQFLGLKQIWVRSDTLGPISAASIQTTLDPIATTSIQAPVKIGEVSINKTTALGVKKRRRPKFVLKVWDKIKEELGTEFTADDYWDATKNGGFNYKDSARHSTILEHLKLIEEAGEIIKINEKPKRYRKLEKNKELSDPKGLEKSEIKEPLPSDSKELEK